MWKRLSALALAAALCLALTAPVATAAGRGNDTRGLTPAMAKAYADILDDRIKTYGYCGGPDNGGFADDDQAVDNNVQGIAYARLIDFDKNGIPELYFYYITQDPAPTFLSDSHLTQELWYWNGSYAEQVFEEERVSEGCYDLTHGCGLAEFDGRLCLASSYYDNDGIYYTKREVLRQFKNGTLSEYRTLHAEYDVSGSFEGEQSYYTLTIDGRQIYDRLVFTGIGSEPYPPEEQAFYQKYTVPEDAWLFCEGLNGSSFAWRTNNVYGLVSQLQSKAMEGLDGMAALNAVAYYGDPDQCRMDQKMASAYAQVLEDLPQQRTRQDQTETLCAILIDVVGDGYPLLLGMYRTEGDAIRYHVMDTMLWQYVNGQAVSCGLDGKNFGIELVKGEPMLCASSGGDATSYEEYCYYRVSECQLTLAHTLIGKEDPSQNYDKVWTLDGAPRGDSSFFTFLESFVSDGTFRPPVLDVDVTLAPTMISALRNYATSAPSYSYPLVTEDEDRYVRQVAQAVADAVGGEITGIYKLADGVYYVVVTVNGAPKGVLVRGVKEGGKLVWKADPPAEPLESDALDASLADLLSRSNVSLDYSRLPGLDLAGLRDYLQSVLDNVGGLEPNDPAKRDLAEFLRSGISSLCSQAVSGKDNRLTLDRDSTAALVEQARQAHDALTGLLNDNNVSLNQPVTIIVRVLWQTIDDGAPCQVTLDRDLLDALDGCTLQLLLGDGQHYLLVSADTLRSLLNNAGALRVQLSRDGERTYTLNFLDENDNLLQRIDAPVTVGLPCGSPTSTIMASYQGGQRQLGRPV